jgi:tetratricopeptide (TPR) repeat protein
LRKHQASITALIAFLTVIAPCRAGSAEATLSLGRKALLNEGIATAWKLSQQAVAEAPDSASAHEFQGEVLFRRGDFTQSEGEFRAALKLDANFALAWWGLARIAECSSLHKTAAQYYGRAYELDPKDPRIFLDWALRLHGPQHIQALQKYLSMADPRRDEKDTADLRQHIQLDQALNDRRVFTLASPYQKTEMPLVPMISEATHMRVYGLEVNINGTPLALQLDTGASGIMLPHRAADRAGVQKLGDANFGGFGDSLKSHAGYRGIAERLRIGSVEFHDALINVSGQEAVGTAGGLIGTDVFSQFLITLDFAAKKLRLDPLPGYQAPDEELHDRVVSAEMRNFVPVFRFGHMLLIPTRVNDSREVHFILDTGSAKTLISYEMAGEASKIKRDDATRINGISGQVADVYQTGDLFLEFAGFRQKNLGMTAFNMWEQSRRIGTEISGFLGLPVLNLFTLTIDYRDGLVNFDRTGP